MGVFQRIVRIPGATAILAAGAVLALGAPAQAQAEPEARDDAAPVLLELFLSQACPMCPPAAELFPAYAARTDVVALTWHVDYWNMTTSKNGRWEDPFSKSTHTERQKRYNLNIRARSSIYTPQVVVNGSAETVGAKAEKIDALIAAADMDGPAIRSQRDEDGGVAFSVGRSDDGGNAYLVTFRNETQTEVTGGKNAGVLFPGAHVVTGIRPLGVVRKRGADFAVPAPAPEEGCALIVQAPGQRAVVAAAYCAR